MPVVHPAEVWKDSGRYDEIGPELVRFKDRGEPGHGPRDDPRGGRRPPAARHRPELPPAPDAALPLPDEVPRRATLPRRPDPRPRVRHEGRLQLRPRRRRARRRATGSSTAPTSGSSSDSGSTRSPSAPTSGSWAARGPTSSWSSTDYGEDTLVLCDACGYAENQQIAEVAKPSPEAEDALPMEDVETPDATTIDALATFLGIPRARTAKATFFVTGDGRFVVAIVRGDYDVNETKLVNAIKATGGLRPAQVEEIKARGMEAGYGSPIGARDAVVVVDELVARSPNLVAGANRPGWHVRNVNVPRDYTPDVIADITNAREGDACARLRGAGDAPQRASRSATSSSSGPKFTDGRRRRVPGRGRRAAPHRHGLVRDRARPERRLHRRGAPRREGDRLAGGGRAVSPPTSWPSARTGSRRSPRSPRRCTRRPPLPATTARSCSTTATSRRA